MEKPPTQKPSCLRKWIRIKFLSGHLKETLKYEKVLDLCCGYGFYFEINPDAYGIDADEDSVRYLKEKGYKVIRGDVLKKLPYPDGHFDLVLTHDVLEHFTCDENEVLFKNVHRILKNDGIFLNVIPNRRGYDFGLKMNAGHKHYIVPAEVLKLGENLFRHLKTYSYPFPGFLGKLFYQNKEVVILEKIN